MLKYLLLIISLSHLSTLQAQDENPKIGSEKGVKEKLTRIKGGLPDIKKNLTKQDELFTDTYNVTFEMGNGIILFEEDEEEGVQSLIISFSSDYFSGRVKDYQEYYKKLVALIGEVFGSSYASTADNTEKTWSTYFFQKEKGIAGSNTGIGIECNWMFEESIGPEITIEINSKVKK